MRARDIVICAVAIVAVVTVVNLLTSNKRVTSTLPVTRLDHARQESLNKPFHLRAHRIERQARLESGEESAISTESSNQAEDVRSHLDTSDSIGKTSEQIRAVEEQSGIFSDNAATLREASVVTARDVNSSADSRAAGDASQNEKSLTSVGRNKYHVVSSLGDGLYVEWQIRLCYYSYKKVKKQFPDGPMGGFTRLLHSGQADGLMEEIPTVIVDKLPDSVSRGYQVINRPYAFHQWVEKYMDSIPEEYVLMAEPDHVFIKPPPLWATPTKAAAYPFWYIQAADHQALISRFNEVGARIEDMNTIGSSPAMLHKSQMKSGVGTWYPLSLRLKNDAEADKKLGWILDMYAWSIACAQAEGGPIVSELHKEFMLQPPFDLQMEVEGKEAFIVHLTYGMDFDERGKMTYGKRSYGFHFDKRDYMQTYPPRNITLPPFVRAPAISYFLSILNEASEALNWPSMPQKR